MAVIVPTNVSGATFGDYMKVALALLALLSMQFSVTQNVSGEFGVTIALLASAITASIFPHFLQPISSIILKIRPKQKHFGRWVNEYELVWIIAILIIGIVNFIIPIMVIREPLHEFLSFFLFEKFDSISHSLSLSVFCWVCTFLTTLLIRLEIYDFRDSSNFTGFQSIMHRFLIVTIISLMISTPIIVAIFL